MYPTTRELRLAREIVDGASHVPTPAVLLGLHYCAFLTREVPHWQPSDPERADLSAAQRRLDREVHA